MCVAPLTRSAARWAIASAESLADWWLDHPDISAKLLASWLMNLVWMGFGDLVDGNVWAVTPDPV